MDVTISDGAQWQEECSRGRGPSKSVSDKSQARQDKPPWISKHSLQVNTRLITSSARVQPAFQSSPDECVASRPKPDRIPGVSKCKWHGHKVKLGIRIISRKWMIVYYTGLAAFLKSNGFILSLPHAIEDFHWFHIQQKNNGISTMKGMYRQNLGRLELIEASTVSIVSFRFHGSL